MNIGLVLLLIGAILTVSIVVALGASRTGIPALVAFLGLGMLLGSDGLGGIEFDDADLAHSVGIVCLVAILFEGGLSTSWRRLREVVAPAAVLSTVGVAITALLTGIAAYFLFDLSWLAAIVLGAVVSSTDAAAVFATLRNTKVRRRLARTLEAETGGNDPMAIALTIGLISWIQKPSYGLPDLAILLIRQLGIGLLVGVGLGALAAWIFARLPHSIGGFAPVASVAAAALSFGATDVMGGSGFLAVYLVGLAVGSTPSRHRQQLVSFHESLAFLAQVAMFIVLGLLVFPHQLPAVAASGLALATLLMFVIRPVAVWVSTSFANFTARERVLLGWAGLRGAVPIVLGTIVLSSGISGGETIFNIVFFVVLVSALAQGTTLEPLAERLGLATPKSPFTPTPADEASSRSPYALVEFTVAPNHAIAGVTVRELGLPRDAHVAAISRGKTTIAPRGNTVIEPDDRIFALIATTRRADLEDVFTRWRRRV